jgi:virulence-associated protein VapD
MATSNHLILKVIKKLRWRKFQISVYVNENQIELIENHQYKIEIADKTRTSPFDFINRHLKNGTCYYIQIDGDLAHFSWLFQSNLLAKQLMLKNYRVIGNCETLERYRGRNLYGIAVSKIIADYPNQKFVLFIEPNNMASIKGVTKIGLTCMGTFEITRFLGLSLKIKKINA